MTPVRTIADQILHLALYADLVTFENKIISAKVKNDQPGKKDGKDFPYHLVLRVVILVPANIKLLLITDKIWFIISDLTGSVPVPGMPEKPEKKTPVPLVTRCYLMIILMLFSPLLVSIVRI